MVMLLWMLLAGAPAWGQPSPLGRGQQDQVGQGPVGPRDGESGYAPTTDVDVLLRTLQHGRQPEQIDAAKDLRRHVRLMISHLGFKDMALSMEARQSLSDLDETLAPVCISKLPQEHLMGVCAEILGMLETTEALPALELALEATENRGARRKVQRSVDHLQRLASVPPVSEPVND
ncbi:MAG: hypothetical protein AAFV53_21415 [Myxococcota bacterium]